MIRINELPKHVGSVITGDFMLVESKESGGNGTPRLQLALHDATGRVTAFIWPEHRCNTNIPALPSVVRLQAEVRMFNNKPQLHIRCLQRASADMVDSASVLLPTAYCPEIAQSALSELIKLETSLDSPLDEFLRRILLDPRIGLPLLTCRASVKHHHACRGGLLVHTMECVSLTAAAIAHFLPKDPQSVAIGSLCQFFHDLGKLCSVGDTRRPRFPFAMRHEIYTVRLLDPHLRWLAEQCPELNAAFEYVLDYIATPYASRKPAIYLVADIVVAVDRWSAAGHNGRDVAALLAAIDPGTFRPPSGSRDAANEDEFNPRHRRSVLS